MTDIEIAQKNKMIPVTDVAAKIGITADKLENYGPYKQKSLLMSYILCKKKPPKPLEN